MRDISGHRKQDQSVIRLPDGMRDQLKEAARANARSMNAEIVARLAASFACGRQLSGPVVDLIEGHITQEVNARLKAITAKIGGAS